MRKHAKGCFTFLLKTAAIFIVAGIIFSLLFRVIFVDGESMSPTLADGDWIMVYKTDEIRRGDIILTNTRNNYELRLIKRAIAFEGDTVDIDFESGTVYVNGYALTEEYKSELECVKGDVEFPITVPDDCVFLLGDNRSNSVDSRYSVVGCIDEDEIIGKVIFRFLPLPIKPIR